MARFFWYVAFVAACWTPGAFAQEPDAAPPSDTLAAPPAGSAAVPRQPDPMLDAINAELDRGVDEPNETASLFQGRDRNAASPMRALLVMIAALCVVLALLFGLNWALRRWGKNVPILAGPNLGKVLGRLYLDRGTALHFVRIGERVLVIGVNSNSISTLGDFSASAFDRMSAQDHAPGNGDTPFNPDSFLAELQERSRDLKQAASLPRAEEDEIAALRGDIQRLQRYLRDENRGHED